MFVIREHISDLGQLVLQLSVGVDLNRGAHIKDPQSLSDELLKPP